jgi:hypothetical protein
VFVIPVIFLCVLCVIFLALAPITRAGKILILACVPIGGFLGYMAGTYLACLVFDGGNLCGLWGIFITGPLGSVAGGVGGWLIFRRRFATA